MAVYLTIGLGLLLLVLIAALRIQAALERSSAEARVEKLSRTRGYASCSACRFFVRQNGERVAEHEDEAERMIEEGNRFVTSMASDIRDAIRNADIGRCHRHPPLGEMPTRRRPLGEHAHFENQRDERLAKLGIDEADARIRRYEDAEYLASQWTASPNRFPLVEVSDWCGEFSSKDVG